MKNSFEVSISTILAVLIFLTQFISLSYFSWYNILRYGTIILLGIYVGKRIRIVLKKEYLLVNGIALLFALSTVYTAYLNRSRMGDRDPFLASIPFVSALILFLFFMEIRAENNQVKNTMDVFYKTAFVITIITDILVFLMPSLFAIYHQYFVGTKFAVVYLHMLLIVLYLTRNPIKKLNGSKKIPLLLLFAWSFIVGMQVNCSTGIVGVFVLLLLIFIINGREKIFLNGIFYCLMQALCLGFVFFYEFVLGNPVIEDIITNYLGRDITLTSRTHIFEKVPVILTKQNGWIKGMGYGSSYDLGVRFGGFPDTQNGILEWIWQVGIPTTIIMVLMFVLILTVARKHTSFANREILLPLISGVYLFTILGTIEITIGVMYFSLMICIMSVAIDSCKVNDSILYSTNKILKYV